MIMHPAIIALFSGSILVSCMVLYSVRWGSAIWRHWNLQSGSELQLDLERKTYLVSTVMSYAFVFELFSLFLFVFTADKLSSLFTGAMCAAGTLNVNAFGYPVLLLKIVIFILGGTWLIMNSADNRAFDYPLIRSKYLFLMTIAPLVAAETIVQGVYFIEMKPHVITSCCGSIFGDSDGVRRGLSVLPGMPVGIAFYISIIFTVLAGVSFLRKQGRLGYVFSFACVLAFVMSVVSLISFISPYFYELPTHRCPFCILQGEYYYIGYILYVTLLVGVLGGTGVGILLPFGGRDSLKRIIPGIMKRLTMMSIISYLLFAVIVTFAMVRTDFRLTGY